VKGRHFGFCDKKLLIATLVLLASASISGCSFPVVPQVPVSEPTPLSTLSQSRPLLLDRVIFEMPRGSIVGEFRVGKACFLPKALKGQEEIRAVKDGHFHQEFERVVKQYNYRLPEKSSSLFESSIRYGTELVLAVKITNIRENRCWTNGGWNLDQRVFLGNVRFSMHWEAYSVADRRVVFRFDNDASAEEDEFKPAGEVDYYVTAFGNGLRGVLADQDFRRIVASPSENR
jgi:hypothetical protein